MGWIIVHSSSFCQVCFDKSILVLQLEAYNKVRLSSKQKSELVEFIEDQQRGSDAQRMDIERRWNVANEVCECQWWWIVCNIPRPSDERCNLVVVLNTFFLLREGQKEIIEWNCAN